MWKRKNIDKLKLSFGKLKEESFDFELIKEYFDRKDNSSSYQVLSDKICNDLDFDELFMYLDRTVSKIGQQYLYNKLRVIPDSGTRSFDSDEEIIEKLENNQNFRLKTQLYLSDLSKEEVYYISSLFQEKHLSPPKRFYLLKLLSFTNLLTILLLPFVPQVLFVFLGVFIVNLLIHYKNKKNLYQYLVSIPQLLKLKKVAKSLYNQGVYRCMNPKLPKSLEVIGQIKNRMSFFHLESKLESDFGAIFWGILEIVKITFILEPILLFGIIKRLDTKRKEIEDVFDFVGKVDTLYSTASLRKGLAIYCKPTIREQAKIISATGIYHPLIHNCVPNSIHLKGKSVLLTGSNMSGKTSFIKTLGVNVICGLTINTCFSDKMELPRTRIYSAIRISDDLMNNKSYYFEEVLTIKRMITESRSNKINLFLLDEIFKGTNTIERISAGKAVLSYLSRKQNIVFVSTHDIELTEMLKKEYELYHFSEVINEKNVDFDYKLKEGRLKNRNAIKILQINDYPLSIIKEAIETSKMIDRTEIHNSEA